MLQKVNEQIAECFANASECRERAKSTLDAATKKDFLELEQRWLSLAHKYEIAERLAIDSPLSRDDRPDHIGGTALISGLQSTSSRIEPMSVRKHVADKLLWQMLERWRRSSPELDRSKFLKTVPFFNELSHRQLKTVSDTMFERNFETDDAPGVARSAHFLDACGKLPAHPLPRPLGLALPRLHYRASRPIGQ
jgi:hypothetical protein